MLEINQKIRDAIFDKGARRALPLNGWILEIHRGKRVPVDAAPKKDDLVLTSIRNVKFALIKGKNGFTIVDSIRLRVVQATSAPITYFRLVNKNGLVITGDVGFFKVTHGIRRWFHLLFKTRERAQSDLVLSNSVLSKDDTMDISFFEINE